MRRLKIYSRRRAGRSSTDKHTCICDAAIIVSAKTAVKNKFYVDLAQKHTCTGNNPLIKF